MPGFLLNADFDQNGRLDANAAEHNAGSKFPGAILIPNLDNDGRRLPAAVSDGPAVKLDYTLTSKTANDNELLPAAAVPEAGAALPLDVSISVTGWLPVKVALYDQYRRLITKKAGAFQNYSLGSLKTRLDFFVEARTLAGTPLVRFPTLQTSFGALEVDERTLNLTLSAQDALGNNASSDSGQFTVASWLMTDNGSPIEKLFICEVDDNAPSIADVRAALPDPSVLVVVPAAVANGDAWLQDQMEIGYCHGPDGVRRVVLHLPRLRANFYGRTATKNLAAFVRGYLPSRDFGLFDDFWDRTIPVTDVNGARQDLTFVSSAAVTTAMLLVYQLRNLILFCAGQLVSPNPLLALSKPGAPFAPAKSPTFIGALKEVTLWAPLVISALDTEAGNSPGRASLLKAFKADITARRAAMSKANALNPASVTITASGWTAEISESEANQLSLRLDQMHHSSNYGGNLELGPAVDGAKLGKIVIGNTAFEKADFVDPDLKRFLTKQSVQPLVEISTEWLAVGHVDEVAAFVSTPKGASTIVMASPETALAILTLARDSYVAGLPASKPYIPRPTIALPRTMSDGLHPVTMMLRGKEWAHSQPAGSSDVNLPPESYILLCDWFARTSLIPPSSPVFTPGPGTERTYDAGVSVREALWVENLKLHADPSDKTAAPSLTTNEYIQQVFQEGNKKILIDQFPNVPVIGLPVLYDTISDIDQSATGAFLPNAVNLVVAGSRLLIPQQFGPRMKPDDAVTVIRAAAEQLGVKSIAANLTAQLLRQKGLIGFKQWFNGTKPGYTALGLADIFRDGFPGVTPDEIAKRIIQANPSAFRGADLRNGWQKLAIPEETVDLFELYIVLAIQSIGLEVRFVDSWYYHVNHGEIHCGTNAIRTPITRGKPAWWTL